MKYFSPGLLDGSVTTAKLADLAVTIAKIDNNAVTNDKIWTGAIRGHKFNTVEASLAGDIAGGTSVDITLQPYTFWPMIHVFNLVDVHLTGHSTDGVGSDSARLALENRGGGSRSYDLDYRYVAA